MSRMHCAVGLSPTLFQLEKKADIGLCFACLSDYLPFSTASNQLPVCEIHHVLIMCRYDMEQPLHSERSSSTTGTLLDCLYTHTLTW